MNTSLVTNSKKANILIVDDTPQNLELLSNLLSEQGFNVRCAINGSLALNFARRGWSDLILLDINMPGMDGYQVCESLKDLSITRNIPIIFITALDESSNKVRAFSAGGADYITKPFQIQEVLARVEHQLALKSALTQIQNLNQNLESQVRERTIQLEQANLILEEEIQVRKKTEQTLKVSEERWRSSITDAPFPIMLHSESGRVLQINKIWTKLTGYEHADMPTISDWTEQAYGILSSIAKTKIDSLYEIDCPVDEGEVEITTKLQNKLIWHFSSAPLGKLSNGERLIISMAMDITGRKKMEAQLVHNALHDSLTGLPNRTLLMERLEIALKHLKHNKNYHFAVLFLDLDHFKRVNDSLGHQIGDQFLLKIAQIFQYSLREIDFVARLGGDEFVILLEDICGIDEATLTAKRIQNLLAQPFILEEHTVVASASIGIVLGSPDYCYGEELLRDADVAMYRAKEAGRAQYEIFDRQMHFEVLQRLQLESELRQAVLNEEFILYYQPIMDLSTVRPLGFEALIRWQHPSGQLVSPNQFITLAEENGLIVEIGDWVLHNALAQLKTWEQKLDKDLSKLEMSVNVSGKQLYSGNLIQRIDHALSQTGVDANCLKLELTESVLIDTDSVKKVLESIRERDIKLSIDDFGTGFSCLGYLNQFPINYLKIDKSFVENIHCDHGSLAIVKAIIALAKNLNMKVIAEGVEEQSQLMSLQEIGCDYAQGYLFSKPLDPESTQEWLMKVV
ncbi:MAG: EAL domain-containing protein [Cyanobacteria bacterium P01_F01_bin.143]